MPVYTYKARSYSGTPVSGSLEALSEDDLVKKLRALNYMPVHVRPEQTSEQQSAWRLFSPQRVKSHDIVMFNMKLSCMIDAGVPLLTSLRIIAEQVDNPSLKNAILNTCQEISEGSPFSDALLRHPRIFSAMYVNMVRVGEMSGTLNVVLNRLAVYIEQEEDLKQRIQGALLYPAVLVVAGCLVVFLIITFVMPQFVAIFTKAKVPLPLPTMMIYTLGVFCRQYWFMLIASIAAGGLMVMAFIGSPRGKEQIDRFVINMPVAGQLLKNILITRFTRTLGILVESGVPILQCLDVVQGVVDHAVYKHIIRQVSEGLEKGEKIAQRLKGNKYFPNDVVAMIATGEESGKLALMLTKISVFYEATVNHSIKKLTTLLEPVFIVILGGVVGLILAAMLLPLFDMVKTLHS